MIKKTITYTDYNGLERTEDFWFNITEAEALEMEMSSSTGRGSYHPFHKPIPERGNRRTGRSTNRRN